MMVATGTQRVVFVGARSNGKIASLGTKRKRQEQERRKEGALLDRRKARRMGNERKRGTSRVQVA